MVSSGAAASAGDRFGSLRGVGRVEPEGSPGPMSIGEVLTHLRTDFPDATISKLRFLEAEGLVEPQRTAAGYRKYTWDDIRRLRFVLTAQRDHYLPLRVIREHLASLDRGEMPAELSRVAPTSEATGDVRLSRRELAERAGVAEEALRDLERHGLLTARSAGRAGGWYDGDALAVAIVAARLAEYGVEGRHLRAYRAAADREVGLFTQLVAPVVRQSDPAARARAQETVRELTGLSQRLHAALVRAGLRDTLGG